MTRPLLILGTVFLLVAVYLLIAGSGGLDAWQLGLILGILLIIIDLDINKLRTKLAKLETASAPPATEEV